MLKELQGPHLEATQGGNVAIQRHEQQVGRFPGLLLPAPGHLKSHPLHPAGFEHLFPTKGTNIQQDQRAAKVF